MLLEMLNILEHFPLASLDHNSPEYVRLVAEAMKRATIDKDRYVGDPRFVEVPVDRLAGKPYAAEMAEEIRAGKKADVPRFNGGAPVKDTTHVSVVDAEGNCVTMTHSLGMPRVWSPAASASCTTAAWGSSTRAPAGRAASPPARPASARWCPPSCGRPTGRTWSSAPPAPPRSRWACCRSCSTRSTST